MSNITYLVKISDPKSHLVEVQIEFSRNGEDKINFYLPSWSPGSYLMREYSRNIRTLKVEQENGEALYFDNLSKNEWEIDLAKSELKSQGERIIINYQVYCHELTVRTSHIDESHAFLHGPSYLIGIEGKESFKHIVEFRFPELWSKLAIGLKDISEQRERFLYEAENYDVFIDAPAEIGCHESDGFMVDGKPHHLNHYGVVWEHGQDLKGDIKKIVETIKDLWGEIPYDQYVFITHFIPGLYGGLEHLNSTALQFDGTKLLERKDYIKYLELVSHEYFHTWNVKRIRPIELGPFKYKEENYTKMHWLTEGLTSFMDKFMVLQSGLMTLEEYVQGVGEELSRYLQIPGRKFHTLEQSSYNAWIKLYRPDENSKNSTVSYYLKGGLLFFALYADFVEEGASFKNFLKDLWNRYKENPTKGMIAEEVYGFVESHTNKKIRDQFETNITTNFEIDFEKACSQLGLKLSWKNSEHAFLGLTPRFDGDRVFVQIVDLDLPAYKAGINAGDEIIGINGVRITKKNFSDLSKSLKIGSRVEVQIARLNVLDQLEMVVERKANAIETIEIKDKEKASKTLRLS